MSDALVNALSGASGGIIAQLITYPLQSVNTRQQTVRRSLQNLSRQHREHRRIASQNTLQVLLAVIKKEGISGLYRGLPPSLLGTATSQGIYYYFYQLFQDMAKRNFLSKNGELSTVMNLTVAAMAGAMNVLITNPIWIVVTRMQTHSQKLPQQPPPSIASRQSPKNVKEQKASTLYTVREIYSEAGVAGFWKGVLPNLVMVSNPAIQFAVYEGLTARLIRNRPRKNGLPAVSSAEIFAMGALAKLAATLATYPLQVVKARVQASQDIGTDEKSKYKGTSDAIIKMATHEGFAGFYGGLSTKIGQSVLAAAILFLIKDRLVKMTKSLLEKRQKGRAAAAIALRLLH